MKIIIVMILYFLNGGMYLWFSPDLKDKYPNEFAAWYFGSEGILISLLLFLSVNAKKYFNRQMIYITAAYIFIRSILYIFNYTLILTINARMRMIYLAAYTLLIIIPICISAYRHGHFKN